MKNTSLCLVLILVTINGFSQQNINIGAGYFGHTITHPGFVGEFELEKTFSGQASIPIRTNLGFYAHPRYHTGIFIGINVGYRRYYSSGWFYEQSIGIGLLETILNTDGVYKVDENGNVSDASKYNPIELMPSISLGLGYDFSKHDNKRKLVWLRPKIFWQYPHKTTSTFNVALQVGVTRTIKSARS